MTNLNVQKTIFVVIFLTYKQKKSDLLQEITGCLSVNWNPAFRLANM